MSGCQSPGIGNLVCNSSIKLSCSHVGPVILFTVVTQVFCKIHNYIHSNLLTHFLIDLFTDRANVFKKLHNKINYMQQIYTFIVNFITILCSNYSFNKNYRIMPLIADTFTGSKGCPLNPCPADGFSVFLLSPRPEEVDNSLRVKTNS